MFVYVYMNGTAVPCESVAQGYRHAAERRFIFAHIYMYMHIPMRVCTYIHLHTCIFISMYVCVCMYIHTHKYT